MTHFSPGSYQYLLKAKTSIPNLYLSGDWVITKHGSWSQEKAYVTGLEAANLVIDQFNIGQKADIIPVEADETHIQFGRTINKMTKDFINSFVPKFGLE